MSRNLARAAAALLATLPAPALAQDDHDAAIWVNVTAIGKVKGRLLAFAEVQPRVGDDVSRLRQLLLRPAIGWQLTRDVQVWQGYARVIDYIEGGPDRRENRSFQQVTWNVGRVGRVEVQSRSRLEQRWRSDGDDTGWRARQMLRFEYPLAPGEKRVAALASGELFMGLNRLDWGAPKGFDQLRSFVGVEVPLAGTSTAEIGYLNQWRDAPPGRTAMTHAAAVNLFVRF